MSACLSGLASLCGGQSLRAWETKDAAASMSRHARLSQGLKTMEDKEERDFIRHQTITGQLLSKLGHEGPAKIFANKDSSQSKRSSSDMRLVAHYSTSAGQQLQFPIDAREAEKLRLHYERKGGQNAILSYAQAKQLLNDFTEQYKNLRTSPVVEITVPSNGKVVVVGDTHGQLQDVLYLFRVHGPPSNANVYLFNGDIADRGPNACEIFFLVIAYFLADPNSVVINRGNHESEGMNMMSCYEGGGFYDEVQAKFGANMYKNFLSMMKVLSLCTVIGEKVLVVHGGLTTTNLTLDLVRSIPHTSETVPSSGDTELRKVWLEMMWSDPQEAFGYQNSDRGAGIMFGPDKTRQFFLDNDPIKLIIRSHELPDNGDSGYARMHYNRLITVFTASNYAEVNRNKGAVLCFQAHNFPEFEIAEHYAPKLDMIARMSAAGAPTAEWIRQGEELFVKEQSGAEECWWDKELQKLILTIVENKPDIWYHFAETITHEGRDALLDYDQWYRVLSEVIGSFWNWQEAWNTWKLGDANGKVNFVGFLKRFTVQLPQEEFMSFKFKTITRVFEKLLGADDNLEQALAFFDPDGDGSVTMRELELRLQSLDVGLTKSQIYSMVRAVFLEALEQGKEGIDSKEFLERLTLVYKRAHENLEGSSVPPEKRLMREAMGRLGQLMMNDSVHFAQNQQGSAAKFEKVFEFMDEDSSGSIDIEEFVKGVLKLPGACQVTLSNGEMLSEDFVRQLASEIDKNQSGSIGILEFLEALEVDSGKGCEMADNLGENILSVLLRYRTSLRTACRCFDPQGKGIISEADFRKILCALNSIVFSENGFGHEWSPSQISDLCEALATEGPDGIERISYTAIFHSMEIVDVDDRSLAGKLSKDETD
eukprot:TRINITY_DN108559_c0_g1_i1.p1 TRINITY_DN108559_c0_g1~~TRINITY_DN108559_c0_g1_i1.p1  ORF type:complete len:878 (+),score=148.08 TRINITY_DN108559_c0_g1_i1:30-2663(+)